ncbi:hypothetical protein JM49_21190 [Pseudomonas chlororaphis subsp. aurantiaca]|nr:hypothetical protein JM49_21190 [Pseudomonas chlororaphis subsp. aurantiaca]
MIFSGHLSDLLGAARSIALFGGLGFALTPGFGDALLNWLISVGRLVWRGLKPDGVAQKA